MLFVDENSVRSAKTKVSIRMQGLCSKSEKPYLFHSKKKQYFFQVCKLNLRIHKYLADNMVTGVCHSIKRLSV